MEAHYIHTWTDLYKELCSKVGDNIPEVLWQDLWHNQVGFMVEEHPFEAPALFYAFRVVGIDDLNQKAQDVTLQINMYLFYETMLDTNSGAYNQNSALQFLDILTKLHQLFHGTRGTSYSEMKRTGFNPVDTGSAGNLYSVTFTCKIRDLSAMDANNAVIPNELQVVRANAPEVPIGRDYIIS